MAFEKQTPLWNLYNIDPTTNEEYALFDSVINEYTIIAGFPVRYYVLDVEKEAQTDILYGENPLVKYQDGIDLKLVYEPSEEPMILDVFGFSSDDSIQYMEIPKTMFSENMDDSEYRPKIGDAIKTLWNDSLYEIVHIAAEEKIFQAKKFIWQFLVRPFRYGHEDRSVDDMVFEEPTASEFPDINLDIPTPESSETFGDEESIETESDEVYDYDEDDDVDTSIYGY